MTGVRGSPRRDLAFAVVVALAAGGCAKPASVPDAARRVVRTVRIGTSARGRPIEAVELGDPAMARKILVVGCVHGDEPAGIAVAEALARGPAPSRADLWIVPDLNPDGVAARTRGNAHGADLNRNFPGGWHPLGPPGSVYYAGGGPLSEPESRAAAALIRRIRPQVGIWFHQHMAVVDTSLGPVEVERRFAGRVGLPARPLTDYAGSAMVWENTVVPRSAFVVELPAGALTASDVVRYAGAVREIAGA